MSISSSVECTICKSNSNMFMEFEFGQIFKCSKCAHLFSENLNINSSEHYTESYMLDEIPNWFNKPDTTLFKTIYSSIKKYVPGNPSIIDIGCGNGRFLSYLKKHNYDNLTGLDICAYGIESGIRFIHQDFDTYLPEQKYDVITTIANIEHLKDVHSYIKKLKTMLNRNGIIIITTIDESSILCYLAKLLYKLNIKFAAERIYASHHLNHFSKSTLLKLIESNELKVLDCFNKNYSFESMNLGDVKNKTIIKLCIGVIHLISILVNKKMLQTIVVRLQN